MNEQMLLEERYWFKGIKLNGSDWVIGYYVKRSSTKSCIIDSRGKEYEIIPQTICLALDAQDKNGRELFVGDMINDFGGGTLVADKSLISYSPNQAFPVMKQTGDTTRIGIIIREDGRICIKTKEMSYAYNISNGSPFSKMEYVDNIHSDKLIKK